MGLICKNGISYGGGGSGIFPHLIVISETGSTVTATKGQTVITAIETSTGHFECDLPNFGTWTIDAILGGDDAQVSLVVDAVKVYTVDDSHFHATVTVKYPSGATCNLAGQGESYYATGSPYTFTVHHAGQYTITVVYDGQTYTETVTVTTTGEIVSKVVPTPSSAPANDINMWLWFGDVSGSYSSLSDIFADSTALATLMSSTDAIDYLVRCTNWISDICGNQSAMSYIGLNDYCANTLLADADWLDGICDSVYFESVLNVKVPTMTSNTTPSGEVIAIPIRSGFETTAFRVYDGDNSSWGSSGNGNADVGKRFVLGYHFTSQVSIRKATLFNSNSGYFGRTFKLAYSDDGVTWFESDESVLLDSAIVYSLNFADYGEHTYWGMSDVTQGIGYSILYEAQMYGRADV